MKWSLAAFLAICFAALSAAEVRAEWWFWYSARQDLGPAYRFPLGYYAWSDFYYDYTGKPVVAPWWIDQGYERGHNTHYLYRGIHEGPHAHAYPAAPAGETVIPPAADVDVSTPPAPLDLPPQDAQPSDMLPLPIGEPAPTGE